MKKIIYFFVISAIFCCISCDEDMYNTVEKFAQKEKVYPAMFDTIYGSIGFERVELDLFKAGRLTAAEINMGKSQKTVVEYDNEKIIIDTLCSWIPIDGLTLSKLYRFKVYTIDEFDNKSVAQEIALIPYTSDDLATVSIATPRVIASPWMATLIWATPSSVLLDYYGLTYSYVDKDGNEVEGNQLENPQISVSNLEAGKSATVKVTYKIVPKLDNVPILDTLYVDQPVLLSMPTSETYQRDLQSRGILSMFYSESLEVGLNWRDMDDFTLQHTTLIYTDTSNPANPVERTLIISNNEIETIVPGLKIGTPFYVYSTYKPEGVENVFIDSDQKTYDPSGLDYMRASWTVNPTHLTANDGRDPQNIVDNDISTFMSIAKPGKKVDNSSVPANELPGFTLDLKQQLGVDYLRIRHRNSTVGLRVWGVSVYGSHDNVNFEPIVLNRSIPESQDGNLVETPNVLIPRSYFRYIKILYSEYDQVNNSALQIAEIYLGASKTPILQ